MSNKYKLLITAPIIALAARQAIKIGKRRTPFDKLPNAYRL